MNDLFLKFTDEDAALIRKKLEKRFSERTAEGCQIRPKYAGKKSYATLTWQGRTHGAHRVAYAVWKRAVPFRWLVCHLCSNPQCVNPSHLVLGTNGQNSDDNLRKTQGRPRPKGHQGRLPEQVRDPSGLSWPPEQALPTPLEAMAFPANTPMCSGNSPSPPDLEMLKLAFPASFPDED